MSEDSIQISQKEEDTSSSARDPCICDSVNAASHENTGVEDISCCASSSLKEQAFQLLLKLAVGK
jgi:hypothetical protein